MGWPFPPATSKYKKEVYDIIVDKTFVLLDIKLILVLRTISWESQDVNIVVAVFVDTEVGDQMEAAAAKAICTVVLHLAKIFSPMNPMGKPSLSKQSLLTWVALASWFRLPPG